MTRLEKLKTEYENAKNIYLACPDYINKATLDSLRYKLYKAGVITVL